MQNSRRATSFLQNLTQQCVEIVDFAFIMWVVAFDNALTGLIKISDPLGLRCLFLRLPTNDASESARENKDVLKIAPYVFC